MSGDAARPGRWLAAVLRWPVDRRRTHGRAEEQPAGVRRRIGEELAALRREERAIAALLGLPVRPRLFVVDEETVSLLRPADRGALEPEDLDGRAEADLRRPYP